MLLENQFITVKKQGCKNIQYYLDLGYIESNKSFTVKAEDLPKGSHAKVNVKCDYCGTIKNISFKDYFKRHDNNLGDCCHKCEGAKYKNTMRERYGVENSSQLPDTREKSIASNRKKYGTDWGMQSGNVKEKSKKTMLKKYGAEHALQVDEFLNKMMETRIKNGNMPTSKPQKETAALLSELYGECELEVPCDRCSLDCVVEVNGQLIDVEYDGLYWHQDTQRDRRRDNFVKKFGYKIFRIKGSTQVPTKEQLIFHIDRLLNGCSYTELTL